MSITPTPFKRKKFLKNFSDSPVLRCPNITEVGDLSLKGRVGVLADSELD
jgi:hypothetical protein